LVEKFNKTKSNGGFFIFWNLKCEKFSAFM